MVYLCVCLGSVGRVAPDPEAQSICCGGVAVDPAAAALYCGVLICLVVSLAYIRACTPTPYGDAQGSRAASLGPDVRPETQCPSAGRLLWPSLLEVRLLGALKSWYCLTSRAYSD